MEMGEEGKMWVFFCCSTQRKKSAVVVPTHKKIEVDLSFTANIAWVSFKGVVNAMAL